MIFPRHRAGAEAEAFAPLLVVVAACPTAAVLALGLRGEPAVGCTLAALGLSIVVCRLVAVAEHPPVTLWPAIVVLAALAVVRAPLGSHDLWSYASYGRMVSEYGADPYRAVPSMFPHDLVAPLVGWTHAPSGYGPLFTAYSAAVASVSGRSLLLLRWGFQLAAALAVVVCLAVLHRAGRFAALTLLGLAPFLWVSVVNGGHNDAMVAAFVVIAVVCAASERFARFAVLIALAALIKVSAVLAAVPLIAVLVFRRRYRAAAIVSAGPVGAVLLSLVIAPRSMDNASTSTRGMVSRTSVWHPVEVLTHLPATLLTAVATAAIGAGVLAISWRRRRDARCGTAVGASLSTYAMAASYTLPWYLVWGLPALGLGGDIVLTGIVAARGSLMLASYQLAGSSVVRGAVAVVLGTVLPLVLLVEFLRRALRPEAPSGTDRDEDLPPGPWVGSGADPRPALR